MDVTKRSLPVIIAFAVVPLPLIVKTVVEVLALKIEFAVTVNAFAAITVLTEVIVALPLTIKLLLVNVVLALMNTSLPVSIVLDVVPLPPVTRVVIVEFDLNMEFDVTVNE